LPTPARYPVACPLPQFAGAIDTRPRERDTTDGRCRTFAIPPNEAGSVCAKMEQTATMLVVWLAANEDQEFPSAGPFA